MNFSNGRLCSSVLTAFIHETIASHFICSFLSASNDETRKKFIPKIFKCIYKNGQDRYNRLEHTPLFSCPFHILSHKRKKKSEQNIIKTLHFLLLLFLWFAIVRFLLGHFFFVVKRHLTVLYSAVLHNFR